MSNKLPPLPPRIDALDAKNVWMYDSGHPGKTVAILGGVHGDEQAGPQAIQEVLQEVASHQIPVEQGRLIIIEGNPLAVEDHTRATTEDANLNREFKRLTPKELAHFDALTYEQKRAQELLPYLDMADASLDLHEFHQRAGTPFIIGESNTFAAARAIGTPYVAAGFSKTEPGGSDGYMAAHGKPGLCFELGYVGDTKENVARGVQAVQRFLGYNGLLEHTTAEPLYEEDPTFVRADTALHKLTDNFAYARRLSSFNSLRPGEMFARDGDKWYQAEPGDVIIFPNPNVPIGQETGNIAHIVKPDFEDK